MSEKIEKFDEEFGVPLEGSENTEALRELEELVKKGVSAQGSAKLGEFFEILGGEDMQAIEEAIKERMMKNLEFFEQREPELFKGLSSAPTEYNLLFDEKGLNIVNLHNGTLMFPEMEGKYTMVEAARNLSDSPLTHPMWKLHTNNLSIGYLKKKDFPITSKIYNALCYSAISYGIMREGMHLPNGFLPTVTLLGLGGGLVLEALRERYATIHALLIFEESLDLFRISCYFVDYPALFGQVNDNACFLFIGSFLSTNNIVKFFEQRKISANYLRLELMLYDTPKLRGARELIKGAYSANARGWGTFDDELIGIKNALANMRYKHNSKGEYLLQNAFFASGIRLPAPICVVGNGPSLDALLPFIKANANRMIIFSCGTAIKPLLRFGIKPDFQFEIERTDYLHTAFEGLDLRGITLVCANLVNPKVLELFDESYLFSRDGSCAAEIHQPRIRLIGASPFVGNAAVSLAAMAGSDVILCGLDCGYIIGATKHAKDSYYGEEKTFELGDLPPDSFPVQPNKDKPVYSDALYLNSRENIESVLRIFEPNHTLNLGEGAYINGAKPYDAGTFGLNKIDKKAVLKEFRSFFSHNSELAFFEHVTAYYKDKGEPFFKMLDTLFDDDVRTKEELFVFLDVASAKLQFLKQQMPYWGVLMGGSIGFYLQIVMLCALAIPKNDISDFFIESRKIFKRELQVFRKTHDNMLEDALLEANVG